MNNMKRIIRDARQLCLNPPPGISAFMDETDSTLIHMLIIGPDDTPYVGGFFYFTIKCTEQYPFSPPVVTHVSTARNTVRYNPNLYSNGRVCLSTLGTTSGPGWVAAMNLESVAVTIQSILNEKPYHNIPQQEQECRPGIAQDYSDMVQHSVVEIAICDALDKKYTYPEQFRKLMVATFFKKYEILVNVCNTKKHLDSLGQWNHMLEYSFKFNFTGLLERLENLKTRLTESEGR